MLRQISEEELAHSSVADVITLDDKPDRYHKLTISLEQRYDTRLDNIKEMTEIEISAMDKISLAQFVKRFTPGNPPEKARIRTNDDLDEDDDFDEEDNDNAADAEIDIESDFIINIATSKIPLKRFYKLSKGFMRRRKPVALKIHKYKQHDDPHQFYFSQLRLYYPHTPTDLEIWEESMEACRATYDANIAAIQYVKSIVMKYEDKVEKAQSAAWQENVEASKEQHKIADTLDPTGVQNQEDLEEIGVSDSDEFVALDPNLAGNMPDSNETMRILNDGKFKRIVLYDLDNLLARTRSLDLEQRSVVAIGVEFVYNLKKSYSNHTNPPTALLVVVQGGGGRRRDVLCNDVQGAND